jgi:type VI secretion system protein ImpF
MSRPAPDQPLGASLLDRLLDAEAAPGGERAPRLDDLKRAVKRDLEMLLNSRCRSPRPPAELDQLTVSVVGYGLPDFTGLDLATEKQRRAFVARIEQTIRRFEPRFVAVEVTKLENVDAHDRTLRLRIEALLRAEPAPEPIVFGSALDPLSNTFTVASGDHV